MLNRFLARVQCHAAVARHLQLPMTIREGCISNQSALCTISYKIALTVAIGA